jgi:hypothetical protein
MIAKIEEKLHRNNLFDPLKKYVAVMKKIFLLLKNIIYFY